jgi:hypothetical protein
MAPTRGPDEDPCARAIPVVWGGCVRVFFFFFFLISLLM